jgi:hypothetical protein
MPGTTEAVVSPAGDCAVMRVVVGAGRDRPAGRRRVTSSKLGGSIVPGLPGRVLARPGVLAGDHLGRVERQAVLAAHATLSAISLVTKAGRAVEVRVVVGVVDRAEAPRVAGSAKALASGSVVVAWSAL